MSTTEDDSDDDVGFTLTSDDEYDEYIQQLETSLDLRQEDWNEHGISSLTSKHFVKTNNGYFQPCENGRLSIRLYRFICNKRSNTCKNCRERKKRHLACRESSARMLGGVVLYDQR